MKKPNGLESLTPTIIKFPFEQIMKSVVNLRLGRKRAGSAAKILAAITGVVLAYNFPQIGEAVLLLLALLPFPVLNVTVVSGLTLACSMLLTSSLLIYLVKKTFQYYHTNKYGFSNSEQRLTERDRKYLAVKFDHLPKDEYEMLIKKLEQRIAFMRHEIHRYKMLEQDDKHTYAKYVLIGLKKGDIAVFQEYYNDQLGRQYATASTRGQQLARLADESADQTDIVGQDEEAAQSRVSRPVTKLYAMKKHKKAKKITEEEESEEAQYDIFSDDTANSLRSSYK